MNQEFGRYRIDRELGRGAMGVVYQAFDTVLERDVAIKTIASSIRDDNLKERFIREAKAAGKLVHPNIVTVYDFGVQDDQLFISMEYVAGGDLFDLISSRPALEIRRRLEILRQVCLGLDFAHSRGIFHRDVKPANIRLDKNGQVKIVDFGLAVIQTSSLTRSNAILGTPSYIAPERLLGGQSDARSDQFAVGIILFELLTYERAFKGENISLVINSILHREPPRLHPDFIARYSELNAILLKAINKNPAQRHASLGEMARELDAVIKRMDEENFSFSGAVALEDTPAAAGLIGSHTELNPPPPLPASAAKSDSKEKKKKSGLRLVLLAFALVAGLISVLYFFSGRDALTSPGTLLFDVRPYAMVNGIIDLDLNEPLGPEVFESGQFTPMRLQLPPGRYRVSYDHPEWEGQSRFIEVEIFSGQISRAGDSLGESFVNEASGFYALPLEVDSSEER